MSDEEFYQVLRNASDAPAGALLKLQLDANMSAYTLPSNTALSRIIFQTSTLNSSKIPASAYILWPYMPRTEPDGYPVIGWAHGTSGAMENCAPSHIKDLWHEFQGPYILALQGYVVVAPDYAGLGVDKDAEGNPVHHQYMANPSHANDVFYSVQAAQSAFEVLSKKFVVFGHSQGAGAAWAAAQRQALQPVNGYLGSIAAAQVTKIIDSIEMAETYTFAMAATLIANELSSIFPSFDPRMIMTSLGLERLKLLRRLQGCNAVFVELFPQRYLFKPNWFHNAYIKAFQNLTLNGGQKVSGPLLVLQGKEDQVIPANVTIAAVTETCDRFLDSRLEYVILAGVSHDAIMYASQRKWLSWIEDRFAGIPLSRGCRREAVSSARPYRYYQKDKN